MDDVSQRRAAARRLPINHFIEYERHNPMQAPGWRWHLATRIADEGRRLPAKLTDGWLREAVKFLRQRKRRGASPTDSTSAVARALAVHRGDSRHRDAVEAWLLAQATDNDVAERTGLHEDAVAAYHALFFAVRDRSTGSSWIIGRAIGPMVESSALPQAQIGYFWKLFAYHGGPVVLSHLMQAVPTMDDAYDLGSLDLRTAEGRLTGLARLSVACLATDDRRLIDELARIWRVIAQMRHDEDAKQSVNAALTPSTPAVMALLSTSPVLIAAANHESQQRDCSTQAVEAA